MKLRSLVFASALLPAFTLAQQVVTAPENAAGRQVYDTACASCHNNPEATKSPPLDTLKRMGPRAVSHALTNGKMKAQAAALTPEQIDDVVTYLSATADIDHSWIAANTSSTVSHSSLSARSATWAM